jgi:hypothetical protein
MQVSYSYGNFSRPPVFDFIEGHGTHIQACKRYPIRKLMAYDADGRLNRDSPRNQLPLKYVEQYEQNQELHSCCRHPERGEIEARFSCVEAAVEGIPNIYIYHCGGCGRQHRRFCVGGGERPFWDVR